MVNEEKQFHATDPCEKSLRVAGSEALVWGGCQTTQERNKHLCGQVPGMHDCSLNYVTSPASAYRPEEKKNAIGINIALSAFYTHHKILEQ